MNEDQKSSDRSASPQSEKDVKILGLENSPWFRLVKVLFIVLSIFLYGSIAIGAWVTKPHKTVDESKTYFECNKDARGTKRYALEKNSLYATGDSVGNVTLLFDDRVKRFCSADKNIDTAKIGVNYILYPSFKSSGNYFFWFFYSVLAFLIAALVLELVKDAFYYIVTGKKVKILN